MDTDSDTVADEKSIEDRGRSSEKRKDSKKRKRSASPVSSKRSKLTKVETPKSGQDKYCLVMQYDDNITFDEFLRTGHYAILKQFLNSPDVDDYILVDHAKNVRQSPNKMHAWNGHNHVHVGNSTSKKYSLQKAYSVNKFKDAVKSLFPQTNKYIPHLEKMRVPEAWVRYVTTRPRKLRIINGCWADILYDINDDKESTNVDSLNARPYKRSKCAQNLDFLVNIIRKYHCKHSGDITKLLHTNIDESERDGIYQILASSYWNTTVKKALMIDQQRTESMTFNELLTEFAETKPTTECCLTVENSKILLENILDRQNIDYKKFTENLYDVLNMTKPKKNLFVLEGVPNAGKSYIARSLLPVARYYAEVRPQQNNNFIYNDATGKNMLLIEEPSFSDPNHLEQFKLIAEGHPTFVNRKNQDAQLLNRTPVIVTTNKPIWSWHPSAKKAFIARGYFYKFNLTSDMLKMVHLRLHPLMWKSIFDKLTETRLKETETITERLHYNYRQHDDHSGDAEETQSVFTNFNLSPIKKDGGQDGRIGESREHDTKDIDVPRSTGCRSSRRLVYSPVANTPILSIINEENNENRDERSDQRNGIKEEHDRIDSRRYGGHSVEELVEQTQHGGRLQKGESSTAGQFESHIYRPSSSLEEKWEEVCTLLERKHCVSAQSPDIFKEEISGDTSRTGDVLNEAASFLTKLLNESRVSITFIESPNSNSFQEWTDLKVNGDPKSQHDDFYCGACEHNKLVVNNQNIGSAICHLCLMSIETCECQSRHIADYIKENNDHLYIAVTKGVKKYM